MKIVSKAKASFTCAISPYVIYGLCYVLSGGGPGDPGIEFDSGIWHWFMIYMMAFGLLIWIASIAFGIKGLTTKDKIYSYFGIALSLLLLAIVL